MQCGHLNGPALLGLLTNWRIVEAAARACNSALPSVSNADRLSGTGNAGIRAFLALCGTARQRGTNQRRAPLRCNSRGKDGNCGLPAADLPLLESSTVYKPRPHPDAGAWVESHLSATTMLSPRILSLLTMLCLSLSWTVVLAQAVPPPQPAQEQFEAAVQAFGRLGGYPELHTGPTIVSFVIPATTNDEQLKEIPSVPFPLALNIHSTRITDAGLKELVKLKHLSSLALLGLPEKDVGRITNAGLKELANVENLSSLLLNGTQITDAGMTEVSKLKHLSSLYISHTQVTDAGLKKVAELQDLSALSFFNTSVTDVGISELARLTNLSSLCLFGAQVTDEGMKELTNLQNLSSLNLSATLVTDVGLKEIAKLNNLSLLALMGGEVTDAGLKEVAKLKNLASLYLTSTQVTDAELKELAKLTNLSTLDLMDTQVTDAGLTEVIKLQNLTSLNLSSTKVTDAGVRELQKALPNCEIVQ